MKHIVLACIIGLSGCASQGAVNALHYSQVECSHGNIYACEDIPNKSRVVDDEVRATTTLLVALPLVLLLGVH